MICNLCQFEFTPKTVPCPGCRDGCLVVHFAREAFWCPRCGHRHNPYGESIAQLTKIEELVVRCGIVHIEGTPHTWHGRVRARWTLEHGSFRPHPDADAVRLEFAGESCHLHQLLQGLNVTWGATVETAAQRALEMLDNPRIFTQCRVCAATQTDLDFVVTNTDVICRICGTSRPFQEQS